MTHEEMMAARREDERLVAENGPIEQAARRACEAYYERRENRINELSSGFRVLPPERFTWDRNLSYLDRNDWRRVAKAVLRYEEV